MVHQTVRSRAVRILAAALTAAGPACAQTAREAALERLKITAAVTGRTFSEDFTRVRAPFDGNVKAVVAAENQFVKKGDVLAILIPLELAAIMDNDKTTPDDVLRARWSKFYKSHKLTSPKDGIVIKLETRPRAEVKRDDFLFTIAGLLSLVSEISSEDEKWVKTGQEAVLWPARNPANKIDGEVVAVYEGTKRRAPTVKIAVKPTAKGILPGEEVEGFVQTVAEGKAVLVPAGAVTQFENQNYMWIRVQTGVTHRGRTEIRSGLEPGETYLDPERDERLRLRRAGEEK